VPPRITPRVADFHDHRGHTVYRIVTTADTADGTFNVPAFHRYSDFLELHRELRRSGGLKDRLPRTFPVPKCLFHPKRVKEDRQVALQAYLRECSTHVIGASAPTAALAALCNFLDLEGTLINRTRTLYYSSLGASADNGSPGSQTSPEPEGAREAPLSR